MLQLKLRQSGGLTANYERQLLLRFSSKMKISEINAVWHKIKDNAIQILKEYFYDRKYRESVFLTIKPLSESWKKRKNPFYAEHFYIDTTEFIESLYAEIKKGILHIKVGPGFEKRYDRLEKQRPIVEKDKENITWDIYQILLKELENYLA